MQNECINAHELKKKSVPGYGSWMQCEKCGATNHGVYGGLADTKAKLFLRVTQ